MSAVLAVVSVSWFLAIALTASLDRVGQAFTPQWQLRLLAGGAVCLSAATSSSVLAAVTVVGVGIGLPGRVLWFVASTAAALLLMQVIGHVRRVAVRSRAAEVFRRQDATSTGVVYAPDPVPEAFAVPGRPGVVVVTTGLRDALDRAELAAVIRHERAHLASHHHLYVQLTELAAHVNPILRRWCSAVRFAAERHADECAAAVDRDSTARALARVALLTAAPRDRLGNLGISDDAHCVIARVQALRQPPPRRQHRVPVLLAAAVLIFTGIDTELTADLVQDRLSPESGKRCQWRPGERQLPLSASPQADWAPESPIR